MKIFFDTCTLAEFLCDRIQADYVNRILEWVDKTKTISVISPASFYTLSYVIEVHYKKNGYDKDKRVKELRSTFNAILSSFELSETNETIIKSGTNNLLFTDLEDSFQYESAVKYGCDVLLTINISDFENSDKSKIEIITPIDFVKKYL